MKKNLITICLSLFCATGFSQSGDTLKYLITYKLKYQQDSTDINSIETEDFYLVVGDRNSKFLSKGTSFKDSVSEKISIGDIGSAAWKDKMDKSKTEFDYSIFKDRQQGLILYSLKIMDDKLFYTQKIDNVEWQIEPETREISGYKAQKATTRFAGRNYTAWFSSEIPITEGPYKFGGLPGLILSLEDTQGHYVFNFKSFEKLKRPVKLQIPPENHRVVSKEELLDLKKRYEENPVAYINNYVGEGGKKVRVQLKNENMKDYIKKRKIELAKKNNPIELK